MASDMTLQTARNELIPGERSVLVVEDDRSFLQRLGKALEQRGFAVTTAESVADGLSQVEQAAPAFAVVDLRLGDGNGLDGERTGGPAPEARRPRRVGSG